MGRNTHDEQVAIILTPELARSLALISAYGRLLEAHQADAPTAVADFYARLNAWGIAALRLDGRSGKWIKELIAHKVTVQRKWWAIRQFLPEQAIHSLANQLDGEVQTTIYAIARKQWMTVNAQNADQTHGS